MKNNFYNKKLEESIKHKIDFIQRGEKYVTCMNYNEYYIEWHAIEVLDPSMFIADYKQIGLQVTTAIGHK